VRRKESYICGDTVPVNSQPDMADTTIYRSMQQAKSNGRKTFAVLIDPDGMNEHQVGRVVELGVEAGVDYFFVGGSLILDNRMDATLRCIQELCQIPTILFPGDAFQIHEQADALLFLSLISGRNPELLIGKHKASTGTKI
jgi:heptaprenylglyceryl phosphate synthase